MKSRKRILSAIASVGTAGVLLTSGTASAVANIQSLDYTRTGSYVIDCGLLDDIEISRDSSWSDALYYAYQFAEYKHQTEPGKYPTADAYRTEAINYFKNNWSAFAGEEFSFFAQSYYEDFFERTNYYGRYQTALNDDYFLLYAIHDLGLEDPSNITHVHGYNIIANYCSGDRIPTTYSWAYMPYDSFVDGYQPILKIGDEEVWPEFLYYEGDERLTQLDNGYSFHRDNFADLKVELEKLNATTVRATYTLKNLTGADTTYGLATISDTELGYNDDAAIKKTDRSFVVTQDNPLDISEEYETEDMPEWAKKLYDYDLSKTFGAQFSINLDPVPTSTFVGYYGDAEDYMWENSERDSYDVFDSEDTGLAFSWQGDIATDEEKVFTATYNVALADFVNNNFYHLADGYTTPTIIESIKNGALYFPNTNTPSGAGKHREWNTAPDGSGESYLGGDIIRAGDTSMNFYEIETANYLVSDESMGGKGIYSYGLNITDTLNNAYADILDASDGNIRLGMYIEELTDHDVETDIDDGIYTKENIISATGNESSLLDTVFFLEDFYEEYEIEGYYEWSYIAPEKYPLAMKLKLNPDFAKAHSNFRMVHMNYNPDDLAVDDYSLLETNYDRETGELTFEVPEDYLRDLFALVYDEEPYPEIPDTGANTILHEGIKSNVIILSSVAAVIASFGVFLTLKKYSKKN